jgi:hypothetical protein
MKITDPQVIEDGEKDLITAVQEDLDLDAVKQILKDRIRASTLSSKGGQIVVHNNEIAFRLDFDINLSGSLLFDRQGNYIDDAQENDTMEPAGDTEMAVEAVDAGEGLTDEEIETSLSDEIPPFDTELEESGLDAADTAEQDLAEQDLEDTLSIGLPEYDLEDEAGVDTQDLESIAESDETPTPHLENESLDDTDFADEAILGEEALDDDINGILKESRDFWDQKKDS